MMQALSYNTADKQLTLRTLPIPEIVDPNDVLLKVNYAGVCGTDVHIIHGEFECKEGGVILGHEFSGVITAIGSDVEGFKVDDQVAIDPNFGCSICMPCQSGSPHYCIKEGKNTILGIFKNGGWAEYALVPVEHLHRLPIGVDLRCGVFSEPLSCIAHGLDKIAPIAIGKRILINGAGIIGHLWFLILQHQGHVNNLTVCDINAKRLQKLKTKFLEASFVNPEELASCGSPDGAFDVIIECSGNATAIENCVELLDRGGKLLIFGVAAPQAKITLSPYEIFAKELMIVGTRINPFTFPKALELLRALNKTYLDYAFLDVKTYKLDEYQQAFNDLKAGSITKAVFAFQ